MEMKEAVELMLAHDRSLDGGSTLLQPYESQAAPIARITVWGILERPTRMIKLLERHHNDD
jgi:hypothetical protein